MDKYPDLANDVSTGGRTFLFQAEGSRGPGATPLHMCGMGRENQHATAYLIRRGARVAAGESRSGCWEVEALDTYGMTPLHRMASNNLPAGVGDLDLGSRRLRARPRRSWKLGRTPTTGARRTNDSVWPFKWHS